MIIKRRNLKYSLLEIFFPIALAILTIYDIHVIGNNPYFQILLISFYLPFIYDAMAIAILGRTVNEKETKMKETLKMMGLRTVVYGISFFIS
jgi:hypothetical protein